MILPSEAFEPWLYGEAVRFGPAPEELLVTLRVGARVTNPSEDDPKYLVAIAAA